MSASSSLGALGEHDAQGVHAGRVRERSEAPDDAVAGVGRVVGPLHGQTPIAQDLPDLLVVHGSPLVVRSGRRGRAALSQRFIRLKVEYASMKVGNPQVLTSISRACRISSSVTPASRAATTCVSRAVWCPAAPAAAILMSARVLLVERAAVDVDGVARRVDLRAQLRELGLERRVDVVDISHLGPPSVAQAEEPRYHRADGASHHRSDAAWIEDVETVAIHIAKR